MNDSRFLSNLLSSKILAASLLLNDRSLVVIESKADTFGFSCRFHSKYPLPKEQISHIEHLMRDVVSKNKIKIVSMVKEVAVNYLIHRGEKKLAQRIKTLDNRLLTLIEIDHFIDLIEEEMEFDLDETVLFKILDLTSYEPSKDDFYAQQYIIKGCCGSDQSEIKNQAKIYKEFLENNHLAQGKKRGFLDTTFFDGFETCVVLEKGVQEINRVKALFKNKLSNFGFKEITLSLETDEMSLFFLRFFEQHKGGVFFDEKFSTKIDQNEKGLGLFSLQSTSGVCVVDLFNEKKALDFTRLVTEFLNSLGYHLYYQLEPYTEPKKKEFLTREFWKKNFSFELQSTDSYHKGEECNLVVYGKDFLGRLWEIGFFEITGKKAPYQISFHLISYELLLALSLEKK